MLVICTRLTGTITTDYQITTSTNPSRNTWLACSYLPFLMDGAGVQACRVQSEGVKNESKGLQETGLQLLIFLHK